MTKNEILENYNQQYANYERLANNVEQALTSFLNEDEISFHTISSRIKSFESYNEKIDRKNYENPIHQIEDFCGIRIVCFYPLDLERIAKVIVKEFHLIESIDKSSQLEPDRFGYRSNHYIVKIKKEWAKAPNYRGLENHKMEIQVRTILMHSWADIEHKLAYKKKEDIPLEFRRKLYQLSALLEIADNQFQELKTEKENFKNSLIVNLNGNSRFDFSKDLNLDTLQGYLDFIYPNRHKSEGSTSKLLAELVDSKISLQEVDKLRIELEPNLEQIEIEMLKTVNSWSQAGIIRAILDLKCNRYYQNRVNPQDRGVWEKVIRKWRKQLNS